MLTTETAHKQSELLLQLIESKIELFHDQQNKTYATYDVNGHKETWLLSSDEFDAFLSRLFWLEYSKTMSNNSKKEVLSVLEAKAKYDGKRYDVYLRVGTFNGNIYIDLCNNDWQIVKISAQGWTVINNAPIKFHRTNSMKKLPTPKQVTGDINLLWKHVNIPKRQQILVLAWLLECFIPNRPYPILCLIGTQGSSKSISQGRLRDLVDPNAVNLRSAPKKADDLPIDATNNHLVSYNNISHLPNNMQDDLCCVSTGGGFSRRQLYTDEKEIVTTIMRPIVLNAIFCPITRPDLLDRSIVITLPRITTESRKTENELSVAFDDDFSSIFSGLLNLLVTVLQIMPDTKVTKLPRMADFAILGTALEQALCQPSGTFIRTYNEAHMATIENAADTSPAIIELISFIKHRIAWTGRYADLLDALNSRTSNRFRRAWPESPRGLSSTIKRYIPILEALDITITEIFPRKEDGMHIEIRYNVQNPQNIQEKPVDTADTVDKEHITDSTTCKCGYRPPFCICEKA